MKNTAGRGNSGQRVIILCRDQSFNIGMRLATSDQQRKPSAVVRSQRIRGSHNRIPSWQLRRIRLHLLLALLIFTTGLWHWPVAVRAQTHAPLDTLKTPDSEPSWVMQSNMNISRKVLPDVQATSLPKLSAPQRPPRLDDPVNGAYQFYLAQQAAAGGNFDLATDKLREANRADPNQARYHWWQSAQALRQFDPGSLLWTLPKAVASAARDPLARKRLLLIVHEGTILYLALFWSLLVAAYLCRYWRYICHDLTAWLFRDPRHKLHIGIAVILPVGLLLLRPGWIGYLALLSVPLCIQARGKARWPLVAVWVAMTLLLFPNWTMVRRAVPAIDPTSETTLLVQASHMPPNAQMRGALQKRLAVARDPARQIRLKLSLAIQMARSGDYDLSNGLYREILASDPDHAAAQVGLANNTYYLGHYDVALQVYEAARQFAPQRGEIPYNMAQAYFKKLFLPEGGDALKQARSLGFTPPLWDDSDGRANGFSPVVYLGPTYAEIAASTAWEAEFYQPMVHIAAWRHWLGCPPLPLFIVLAVTLVLALGLVYGWSHQKDPRNCDNCGWIICRKCCHVHDETWLCHRCGETTARSKSEMVMATLLKNRSRTQGIARVHRLSLLGRMLPGTGHLALGYLFGGLLRVSMLATGLFLVLFAWSFDLSAAWELPGLILAEETIHPLWLPLPSAAWPGWTGPSLLAGILIIVIMYVIALLDAAQLRQRLPKRFHVSSQEFERTGVSTARRPA